MKPIEKWKPVVGFESFYEVSNQGRMKVKARMKNIRNGGKQPHPEKIMKLIIANTGYSVIGLWNGKGKSAKTATVHRLVAAAFIPNPEGKKEVNHKNGVRTDNRVENLEWATSSENALHKYQTLGYVCPTRHKGSANSQSKLTEETVREILTHGPSMSRTEAAKRFKISKRSIQFILQRKTWRHVHV